MRMDTGIIGLILIGIGLGIGLMADIKRLK